jgi:hypothetical protein
MSIIIDPNNVSAYYDTYPEDFNRYAVFQLVQNNPTELAAYEAWVAARSAAAINTPPSS